MTSCKLSLPMPPVEAEVTWEQIRAYLTVTGWRKRAAGDDGVDQWVFNREPEYQIHQMWIGSLVGENPAPIMERVIVSLARIEGVAPGEMLRRIATAGTPVGAPPEHDDANPHARHALCEMLDRLGADGVCAWINSAGVREMQDDLYQHSLWLESHAAEGARGKAAALAESMGSPEIARAIRAIGAEGQ